MGDQVVQGQHDEGLKETIAVWEPGEELASTDVNASKDEVASIKARVGGQVLECWGRLWIQPDVG